MLMADSYHAVGRSIHNVEAASIVRVLWHPLATDGGSLLVLTDDAYLRFVYHVQSAQSPMLMEHP